MVEQSDGIEALEYWVTSALSRGGLPIVTHRNGDMDTIASACAMAAALGTGARACGVHVSKLAQRVTENCGASLWRLDPKRPAWPRILGGLVVVDAASRDQTGIILPDVPLCVVDHHSSAASPWNASEGDLLHIIPDASSTSEMIGEWLLRKRPSALNKNIRCLLIAGIVADTGRFRHGGSRSLSIASELAGESDLLQSTLSLMDGVEPDRSTRSSMLRSITRCTIQHAGNWLVAVTDARTHEGRIASSLIQAGADVSLVLNEKDGGLRITCRASRNSIKSGVNLGAVMSSMAQRHGGEGGGHSGAAGSTLPIDRTEAVSGILSVLSGMGGVKAGSK